MSIEIRSIRPEEAADFVRVDSVAFGSEPAEDDLHAALAILSCEQALGAFERGRVVASAAHFPFQLTLPGPTTIDCFGVTFVGVLPTHRRRGLLRSLMQRQLDDLDAQGAALSILYSSESGIYGRFGYGVSSHMQSLQIEKHAAAFRRPQQPSGSFELIDRIAALDLLPPIHDRFRLTQPGAINRTRTMWEMFYLSGGGEKPLERFQVLYRDNIGVPTGYARYQFERHWELGRPEHRLILLELIALSPEAYASLWSYCLNLDLVRTVEARRCSIDEPLRWLLAAPRNLHVITINDGLWVRLIDIPTALTARRYTGSARLVFDVADSFLPRKAGRYLLEVVDGEARCVRTERAADLALSVDDLGALFLGGVRPGTLALAGRLSELRHGAITEANTLFASPQLPWCPTPF